METKQQSIDIPILILSHQYWASEPTLVAGRRNQENRYSQTQGMKKYLRIIVFELGREFSLGVEKAKAKSCLASKPLLKNVFLYCKRLVTPLLS